MTNEEKKIKRKIRNSLPEVKEKNKQYREENKDKIKENNKKWNGNNPDYHKNKLKEFKENNPNYYKEYSKEWEKQNAENIKIRTKEYKENNRDKIRDNDKKWSKENKDYIKIYKKEYNKNRRLNDPFFKLKGAISAIMRKSFRDIGLKKDRRTEKILNCTNEFFKNYIEQQFEEWMNWNNQGKYTSNYNETWQYDHIYPIGLAKTIDEIVILNHYLNFRPFCSKLNLEKSHKIDYKLINNNKELKKYLIDNNILENL